MGFSCKISLKPTNWHKDFYGGIPNSQMMVGWPSQLRDWTATFSGPKSDACWEQRALHLSRTQEYQTNLGRIQGFYRFQRSSHRTIAGAAFLSPMLALVPLKPALLPNCCLQSSSTTDIIGYLHEAACGSYKVRRVAFLKVWSAAHITGTRNTFPDAVNSRPQSSAICDLLLTYWYLEFVWTWSWWSWSLPLRNS